MDVKTPKWLKDVFNSVAAPVKRAYDAADNRVVQWLRGSHEKRLEEILARVAKLPGGEEMLKQARENGVTISVVAPRNIDQSFGRFSRSKSLKQVRVSNIGDSVLMAATLWHELRHVQQHVERGDMDGGTTRLHDTRMQHMISLMHEADAFTVQTLMALRQKKDGNPEYIEKLLQRTSPAFRVARDFIEKNPYEAAPDEMQYARRLFTEIMLRGLPGYNAKYFENYAESFEEFKDATVFRKRLGKRRAAADFDGDGNMLEVYGDKYVESTSVRGVAGSFLHTQPKEAYDVLKLIEETSARAKDITEQDFAKAKKEIVTKSKSLAKAFRKASLKFPEEARTALREAANANRPPLRDRAKSIRA